MTVHKKKIAFGTVLASLVLGGGPTVAVDDPEPESVIAEVDSAGCFLAGSARLLDSDKFLWDLTYLGPEPHTLTQE